jgi:hypothetical protein
VVACHEGGYAPAYVPWCALAILEVFAETRTSSQDPALSWIANVPGQDLQPHQADVIAKAAAVMKNLA